MLRRPDLCRPCVLDRQAEGYAPADGPPQSWLLLVGEALGKVEAITGRPFMGDAGGMLQRLLNMLGWTRDSVRIHNTISCRPPGDWFDERAPWYYDALNYCPYLESTLNEGHKVVVPMGATALKRVLGLQGWKKIRVHDFHGTVQRDPFDRFWVVPTFHPSFLQRGAHNLIGTVLWDLRQAEYARDHGRAVDQHSLVVDPPLDWFKAWVDLCVAARQQDPWAYPLTNDVETPDKAGGKDEGEITQEDRSMQILRQNWACHTDEGGTVPHVEPFIGELRRLYQSPGPIWMWNKDYDFPRQVQAGILREEDFSRVVDLMWLWHYLQSDLPRGLGFAAPFYSAYGPWKHLAEREPAKYGAIDGLQNHRVGFGVLSDLIKLGMYAGAMRHVHHLHWTALRPAQLVGVKIDRQRLIIFKNELTVKAQARLDLMHQQFPSTLAVLSPKQGLTRKPAADILHVKATAFTRKGKPRAGKPIPEIKLDLYKKAIVVEKLILKEVLACVACGEAEVHRKHRCKDKTKTPNLTVQPATVTRWYWQEPFNPDSWQQVLAYIKHRKHQPGRAKKTYKETTNRETVERLEKTTKDPFYGALLDYRAVTKVKSTYVEGTERRLDSEDRVHPTPTFKPSMGRLSYVNPNITNVVADKGAKLDARRALAAGFRKCVVAAPGCRLLEVDFRGIEAIKIGYRAGDPDYIRLGKLGVHSGLASYVLNKPFDRAWLKARPEDLKAYFDDIKKSEPVVYDRTKHFVHAKAYGLTKNGMVLQFPDLFSTLAVADKYWRLFDEMAPKVSPWQKQTQERAARDHYLGGPGDHPYGYKHWFWSVFTYKRLTNAQYYRLIARCQKANIEPPIQIINGERFRVGHGEDAKRALAFYGQSIAGGDLKEAMIGLFDPDSGSYVGDAYYGETPFRAPIHDALLLEVPDRQWDRVVERVALEMQRPLLTQPLPPEWDLGTYLSNEVAAKVGRDWEAMEDLKMPGFSELEPDLWTAVEEGDEEDGLDLGRAIA